MVVGLAIASAQVALAQTAGISVAIPTLTPEQVRELNESRDHAEHELTHAGADHLWPKPDVGMVLAQSNFSEAMVTITSVTPPSAQLPFTKLTLHVDKYLRRDIGKTDLYAESRWNPRPRFDFGGPPGTVLDYSEPQVGDRYLIAFDMLGDRAYIPGAIAFSDPNFEQTLSEVQRFLSIESETDDSYLEPFLNALADPVPWIRDISATRLLDSDRCRHTHCILEILTTIKSMLSGKGLFQRREAVNWLHLFASLNSGELERLPTGAEQMVKDLLGLAESDSNLVISDDAFTQLELLKFFQSSSKGECILIIPALRKVIRHDRSQQVPSVQFPATSACSALPTTP